MSFLQSSGLSLQPLAELPAEPSPERSPSATLYLRLPATSANLGPGFDALGLSLGFALHVEAARAAAFHITATGRDAGRIADPETSLLLETYRDLLNQQGKPVIPLQLALRNQIPLSMGCGSSAAALVAGIALAIHFGRLQWSRGQLMDEASRREGHPDNVAACVLGGLTISSSTPVDGGAPQITAVSLPVQTQWPLLLVLPDMSLSTHKARALLPESYSKADAIANVQAAALLTAAFATGRGDLLATAMQDRMHQPYRSHVAPLLPALLPLQSRVPGVLGVALSGAGPSVLLVLQDSGSVPAVRQAISQRLQTCGLQAEILETHVGTPAVTGLPDYL